MRPRKSRGMPATFIRQRVGTWRVGALLLAAGIGSVGSGCVYQRLSLREEPEARESAPGSQEGSPGEEESTSLRDFPASVAQEDRRREKRRFWALALSPAEIAAGAGITALAIATVGAPVNDGSEPSTGVFGRLKDSGKSAMGTFLLLSVGGALMTSGLGDLALGLSDRWLSSPFLGRGPNGRRLLLADHGGPPSPVWQLDGSMSTPISFRGAEVQLGLGLFRWLSPHWRFRLGGTGDYGARFAGDEPDYFGVSPSMQIDWNPGRRQHYGRYPRNAITFVASPRLILSASDGRPTFGWRAGIGYSRKDISLLIGTTQIPSEETVPVFELSLVYQAMTD